jgi:hypothetical protein
MISDTASRIAAARASAEGREGVAAFLEKRKPVWGGGKTAAGKAARKAAPKKSAAKPGARKKR